MGKHAYLIMAHDEPELLKILIECIDDSRNDIIIHLDKKSDIKQFHNIKTEFSRLKFIEENKRIDVRWGDISLIKAELVLFEEALKDDYTMLHLISGHDLPIKSQDYIHDYCDRLPAGTNLIEIKNDDNSTVIINFRAPYKRFFLKYCKSNRFSSLLVRKFNDLSVFVQEKLHYIRNWERIKVEYGSNWVSITPQVALSAIKCRDFIDEHFSNFLCADEHFLQTIVTNSRLNANHQCPLLDKAGNLREIDWARGNGMSPYTYVGTDYEILVNSPALFARKFSFKKSPEIINAIKSYVNSINYK